MVGQQLPCVLSEYAIPHDAFSRPGPRRAPCLLPSESERRSVLMRGVNWADISPY